MLREKLAHKTEDNIGLSQTTQSIVIILSHGVDHVLNVDLRVNLVIPFIFTDIQRVTTWLFDKSNGVCFVQRWLVYSAVVL